MRAGQCLAYGVTDNRDSDLQPFRGGWEVRCAAVKPEFARAGFRNVFMKGQIGSTRDILRLRHHRDTAMRNRMAAMLR